MTSAPSYADASDRFGFAALNQAQRDAAKSALDAWAAVANITFVEVSDSGSGGFIRIGTNDQRGVSSGYAYYPGSSGADGDIYLANDQATNLNPTPGNYGYLTILHEIGHAIGLKHPGNYNAGGGGSAGPFLPSAEDSFQYSLMSYNEHPSLKYNGLLQGPALYDIAAIQYLYGANTQTNTGNDTYSFNDPGTPFSGTIWDSGGVDTIDVSGQTSAVTVSLVAGTFSSIGPNGAGGRAINNLSIAFGVTIENVIGGSGNDILTGNAADNIITGGRGNDTIDGGAGTDTAVFSGRQIDYQWTNNNGIVTIVGPDGTDTLISIEILRFDDSSVNLVAGNPIYRFYNSEGGTHFYTASQAERNGIIDTLPSFIYEGPAFAAPSAAGTSVWRFFSSASNSHFYTVSDAERDWIIANMPTYSYEGEAYKASLTPADGLTALYRFNNIEKGAHFFTASAEEAAIVEATLPHFLPEGVAYYVGVL
jgi:serralysin